MSKFSNFFLQILSKITLTRLYYLQKFLKIFLKRLLKFSKFLSNFQILKKVYWELIEKFCKN